MNVIQDTTLLLIVNLLYNDTEINKLINEWEHQSVAALPCFRILSCAINYYDTLWNSRVSGLCPGYRWLVSLSDRSFTTWLAYHECRELMMYCFQIVQISWNIVALLERVQQIYVVISYSYVIIFSYFGTRYWSIKFLLNTKMLAWW